VVAVAAGTMFARLGSITLEEHEAKAALAARAMLHPRQDDWIVAGPRGAPIAPAEIPPHTELNRWLVPVNNGLPRLQKTPLQYWLMAAAGGLAGRLSEWAARAPSAVSAVLCAVVVLALGRRMFGPRPALWGALLFATSVGVQKWGRSARPEMVLCLCITAAMGCFYMGLSAARRRDRALWMLAFWAAMALANLAKEFFPLVMSVPLLIFVVYDHRRARAGKDRASGLPARGDGRGPLAMCLIGLAGGVLGGIAFQILRTRLKSPSVDVGLAVSALLVLAPIAWYALVTRGWRGVPPLLPTAVPGAVLMFAAFLPWMWYMRKLFGGAEAIFSQQVARRAAGDADWAVQAPWYYIVPLITFTLPWLALLPGALAAPWLKAFAARRRELVYLMLWWTGLFAMLTASAGKRPHYLLPAVAAICLLMGYVADDVFRHRRWATPAIAKIISISYGAVAVAGVAAMAVLWLAARRFGSEIAARAEQGADISRALLNLRFPIRWLHMLIVLAVIAVPAVLAAWASLRRPGAALPLLLAVAVVLYVGFHLGERYWDDRAPAAEFARLAKARVGDETRIASWGAPQAKVVYYFGRNIPSVNWRRSRLIRRYGKEEGRARWERWLSDPSEIQWMFSYGLHVVKYSGHGFRVDTQVRGLEKKAVTYTLSAREGR